MTPRRADTLRRAGRRARVAGAAVFAVGLVLPVVLFGRVVRDIAAGTSGWTQLPRHGLVARGSSWPSGCCASCPSRCATGATPTGASRAAAPRRGRAGGSASSSSVSSSRPRSARSPTRCKVGRRMSRFAEPQDPLFRALNRSLGFDRRLCRQDLASPAPTRACSPRRASSPTPTATRCWRRSMRSRRSSRRAASRSGRRTRTSTWPSSGG